MITRLNAEECGERLRTAMRGFMLRGFMSGSRADSSGFRLARGTRTAIRIRGTFAPRPDGGTFVEYRVEFLPVALWVLAVTTPNRLRGDRRWSLARASKRMGRVADSADVGRVRCR